MIIVLKAKSGEVIGVSEAISLIRKIQEEHPNIVGEAMNEDRILKGFEEKAPVEFRDIRF